MYKPSSVMLMELAYHMEITIYIAGSSRNFKIGSNMGQIAIIWDFLRSLSVSFAPNLGQIGLK